LCSFFGFVVFLFAALSVAAVLALGLTLGSAGCVAPPLPFSTCVSSPGPSAVGVAPSAVCVLVFLSADALVCVVHRDRGRRKPRPQGNQAEITTSTTAQWPTPARGGLSCGLAGCLVWVWVHEVCAGARRWGRLAPLWVWVARSAAAAGPVGCRLCGCGWGWGELVVVGCVWCGFWGGGFCVLGCFGCVGCCLGSCVVLVECGLVSDVPVASMAHPDHR